MKPKPVGANVSSRQTQSKHKTIFEVLKISPGAKAQVLKDKLIEFFTERVIKDIYKTGRGFSQEGFRKTLADEVFETVQQNPKLQNTVKEATKKIQEAKQKLDLPLNTAAEVVYEKGLERGLQRIFQKVFENKKDVKVPRLVLNEDELYASLKEDVANVLRDKYPKLEITDASDDEVYKKLSPLIVAEKVYGKLLLR